MVDASKEAGTFKYSMNSANKDLKSVTNEQELYRFTADKIQATEKA